MAKINNNGDKKNINRKNDYQEISNSKQVKIAGAGLAGMSAAITLLKNGYDVTVYEKQKKNYEQKLDAHGILNYLKGNVSFTSLNELMSSFNIKIDFYHKYFKILRYGPGPNIVRSVVTNNEKPVAYSIERGNHQNSAEQQLRAQAIKNGCEIIYGEKAPISEMDIIATGNFSKNIIGVGSVYNDCSLETDCILMSNDPKYSPGGYFYILPLGKGKAVAILTSFKDHSIKKLRIKFTNALKEIPPINEVIKNATKCHNIVGYGSTVRRKSAIWNGKFIIGEAGGFLDTLWGFGTINAIRSGYYAASSIINNISFDQLWKKEIGKEIYSSHLLRALRDRISNEQLTKKFEKDPETMLLKPYLDKRTTTNNWKIKRKIIARSLLYFKEKKNKKNDFFLLSEKLNRKKIRKRT
ncbi:MAG: NAD(P)/FAD-dependent oxidoreductase [Candidatus Kariarchaeaceae archaeon]